MPPFRKRRNEGAESHVLGKSAIGLFVGEDFRYLSFRKNGSFSVVESLNDSGLGTGKLGASHRRWETNTYRYIYLYVLVSPLNRYLSLKIIYLGHFSS